VQVTKLIVMQFSHNPIILSVFGTNILHGTLSQMLSVYVLPLISDTKFHTHTKIAAEFNSFYILILLFLDSRHDDKRICINGSKH
jgi:hypothetical protein